MLSKLLQRLLPVVETARGKSFISIFTKVEETFSYWLPCKLYYVLNTLLSMGSRAVPPFLKCAVLVFRFEVLWLKRFLLG